MKKSTAGRRPKLRVERIARILLWHFSKRTLAQVGAEEKVSRSTIRNIIRNAGAYKSAPADDVIHAMMVVSTQHVTVEERDILDAQGYSRGEYGWLIWVGREKDFPIPEIPRPSEGLRGVIERARAVQCTYVLMDRDADTLPDLPVYDW